MGEWVYIKLATEANGHPNQQKMLPSSFLGSHALVLDAQGFGAARKHKSKQRQAQNGTGGNDRPSQVNDYAMEISHFLILIRDLARRNSLRTSELSLSETAIPNETVPVNEGDCLRLSPSRKE